MNAATATLYGGFDLRRNDRDPGADRTAVWGGATRAVPETATAPAFVEDLQNDFVELGFRVVGGLDGLFGPRTEWAVREFQIHASLATVATETGPPTEGRYSDRLRPVATGAHRYEGPISGVLNEQTRTLVDHWKGQRWRCPVVIEAWEMLGGRRSRMQASNLWYHDDIRSSVPRMFVRDLSAYYDVPAQALDEDLITLGDYTGFAGFGGPRSVPPRHTWRDAELLPESLTGSSWAALSPGGRSTYRVVRAVSEVECLGFADSLNAYDNAFLSLGPCHWTLGIANRNRTISEGELSAFLAYFRSVEPDAWEYAFGRFGMQPDKTWDASGGDRSGARLFKSSQRKYACWLSVQSDDGSFRRLRRDAAADAIEYADYFRTWHWFYRFAMAARTVPALQRRMWDMARIRLRDLLAAPWPADADDPGRTLTAGEIFTSERAVAQLLRWHIRFPAHMVAGGKAGTRLVNALTRAKSAAPDANWTAAPNRWGDDEERFLLEGLREEAMATRNEGLQRTLAAVAGWPAWVRGNNPRRYRLSDGTASLASRRGSFRLDADGLPPPPW